MLELVTMITNTKWQNSHINIHVFVWPPEEAYSLREERACITNIYYCLTCNIICVDAPEYKMSLTFAQIRPCICCLAGGWMLCDLPPLITTISNIILYTVTLPHWSSTEWHQMAGDDTLQNPVFQKHRWYTTHAINWGFHGNYTKGQWAVILQNNIHTHTHTHTHYSGFHVNYRCHYESIIHISHSSCFHGIYMKGQQALIL